MKRLVVLSGAGMSAESGIQTFRDAGGLWEGHDIMEVASPVGFKNNPAIVLDFYNQRRKQLQEVSPNQGHCNLVILEKYYQVNIITQNVDDLHERAGSKNVLHLHGELKKARSTKFANLTYDWVNELVLGDVCEKGFQLRPDIVWFGEAVPLLDTAIDIVKKADILVIIGTSMQVYPAAGLIDVLDSNHPIYFINPKPNVDKNRYLNLEIIKNGAVRGTEELIKKLIY